MATRNDDELPPGFTRAIGRARAHSAALGEKIAALDGAPSERPVVGDDFDDLSGVTEQLKGVVEELKVRDRQSSAHEIHVHTAPAAPPVTVDKHDSVPDEVKIAWKHRGLVLKALPWIAALGLGAGAERVLRVLGILN